MNDETTRLISEETAPIEQTKTENKTSADSKKTNQKKGKTVAAAAGGFAAGAAVGVGATAAASTTGDNAEIPEAPNEEAVSEKSPETPSPEQVILANDEGIRYAHVNADNFQDAFAQAREQVGPGGVFEYNGRIYATYYAEEWNEMSPQERVEFQSKVYEIAPSQHAGTSNSGHSMMADNTHTESGVDNVIHTESAESIPANAEMIAAEPADNEIRVLGVEAVQNDYGQIMNVALVECEGDQALLIDVDNNGIIDVSIHDDNFDGEIQESEIHDISGAGLEVAALMQAHAAQEGDMLYASCDDMPDYVNDADSMMIV